MTSRTLVEGLLRRVRPPKPRLFAWKKSATRRAVEFTGPCAQINGRKQKKWHLSQANM